MGMGRKALFTAVAGIGLYGAAQLLAEPDCTIDGDAGVHLADNGLVGYLGENGLQASEDGSVVFYGVSNPMPFCNVVEADSIEPAPMATADFSQVGQNASYDDIRVGVLFDDGTYGVALPDGNELDGTVDNVSVTLFNNPQPGESLGTIYYTTPAGESLKADIFPVNEILDAPYEVVLPQVAAQQQQRLEFK